MTTFIEYMSRLFHNVYNFWRVKLISCLLQKKTSMRNKFGQCQWNVLEFKINQLMIDTKLC